MVVSPEIEQWVVGKDGCIMYIAGGGRIQVI